MDTGTYSLDTTWRMLLRDLGLVPADVLRRAGLPEGLLQQANVRLPTADYFRLWQALEAELGDPALPVRVCEAARTEAFSPAIFAAMCSPDLLTAGKRLAHYKRLAAPIQLDIREDGDRVSVTFVWLDSSRPPPPSLVLMDLLMCATLARMGTRETICPVEVTTSVQSPAFGQCEAYLGAPIIYGPHHRVTFAMADATRPFLTSNEALWQTFEPDLRQRLVDLDAGTTISQRVRAALLEGLPSGLTAMDTIARRLGLSKRTMQRRIEAEGARFQDILQQTRTSLARHYLEKTVLPIAEISFLLGFEEPNSFYRAFKAWTGTTPDHAREGKWQHL